MPKFAWFFFIMTNKLLIITRISHRWSAVNSLCIMDIKLFLIVWPQILSIIFGSWDRFTANLFILTNLSNKVRQAKAIGKRYYFSEIIVHTISQFRQIMWVDVTQNGPQALRGSVW